MYWPVGVPRIYALNGPGNKNIFEADEDDEDRPSNDKQASEGQVQEEHTSEASDSQDSSIIGLQVSRHGHIFATITKTSLAIWQARPTAVLTAITRSRSSLKTYGANVALQLRPDSAIAVVQTQNGYLITYTIATDQHSRVYRLQHDRSQSRRHSLSHQLGVDDEGGLGEISIRFRIAIKMDAGISKALALDEELVVATAKPAAIQCIRWTPDSSGTQMSTELLSRIPWISKKTTVVDMVYDRAMNLTVWITADGQAYAVQRLIRTDATTESNPSLFHGYCFHTPDGEATFASRASVNARFSLLAVSCANGEIWIYTAKDYAGNIVFSHKMLPFGLSSIGKITLLSYSPDGYCLFAGCQKGWMTWSVFGKPGGSSTLSDKSIAEKNQESWLHSISAGAWLSGGSEILLTADHDDRLWILQMARSAVTGCFSSANLLRGLLQTSSDVVVYRGHELPDLTSISGEASLWHHAQYPASYLLNQWPIRCCVVSSDGRYVAIAGRRGLAHYSVNSGRWKTFDEPASENSFAVRGGMCWYGHVLVAATESDDSCELRVYSRETDLNERSALHIEVLPSPAVLLSLSGEDSLLVYTYENTLYHYIINVVGEGVHLVQVGQIAFHGIVRAPARVRAVSWVLPDNQLRNGDPSQDVAVASVLFLVDGKLVLLQPSRTEEGALKYDMRVIAHNVEFYILMRDQLSFTFGPSPVNSTPPSPSAESVLNGLQSDQSLRDSLWVFNGNDLVMWNDVQDVLRASSDVVSLPIFIDFYPLSILLNRGVILGIESEMIQRRDVTFALFRFAIRTHLFLPYVLRHQLSQNDTPAALHFSHQYRDLPYFPHALEVLLHNVLDDEVDVPSPSLLPKVLNFLSSSFASSLYLDVLVQCTRKTELRSWHTLFRFLPSPRQLFNEALGLESLKTAGGYLLVLHALDDAGEDGREGSDGDVIRLLSLAKDRGDWELCGELARFLMALDASGDALRKAVVRVGLRDRGSWGGRFEAAEPEGVGRADVVGEATANGRSGSAVALKQGAKGVLSISTGSTATDGGDYFAASPG